jgi:hypothetical protein
MAAAISPHAPDVALRRVPTDALEKLYRLLHRGELHLPLRPVDLAAIGLQSQTERILAHLRGLDAVAVRAVLVATLAERLPERGA